MTVVRTKQAFTQVTSIIAAANTSGHLEKSDVAAFSSDHPESSLRT